MSSLCSILYCPRGVIVAFKSPEWIFLLIVVADVPAMVAAFWTVNGSYSAMMFGPPVAFMWSTNGRPMADHCRFKNHYAIKSLFSWRINSLGPFWSLCDRSATQRDIPLI